MVSVAISKTSQVKPSAHMGIDDNTTGIDGTFVTPQAPKVGNIYTVNGQLVRCNSTAAGLARGVYIMNGIKLIVK